MRRLYPRILQGHFHKCLCLLVSLLALGMLTLMLSGCGKAASPVSPASSPFEGEEEQATEPDPTPVVKVVGAEVEAQLEQRMEPCTTLEEAIATSGMELTVPDCIGEYEPVRYRAIPEEIVEVLYRSPEGEEIRLRKGPGQDDLSGDYESYHRFDFSIVGDVSVFHRYDDAGTRVATWTNGTWAEGTYTYAVTSTVGLTNDVLHAIIENFV